MISVILCSFALNSESKQFCDSFQDNDYKIDYTLEYFRFRFTGGSYWYVMDLLVVIGSDYWIIEMKDENGEALDFNSLESQPHNLSGHYSAAFLRDRNFTNKVNIVGFIPVREPRFFR